MKEIKRKLRKPDRNKKLYELWKKGVTLRDLGRLFGISHVTVLEVARLMDSRTKKGGRVIHKKAT